jgi:4a-hydroxytetrahydrobiopterin dehydratase
MKKLESAEITEKLAGLPGWSVVSGKLHREYKFSDFERALGFMLSAAPAIGKMDHHPEWANVYSTVTVDLTTHSAGGITAKDFQLAQVLEDLAKRLL